MGKDELFPNRIIYEKLFHYLWKKPSQMINYIKLNLPHTIIYQNSLPVHWYFSDKNQIIRKKQNQNLNRENILNAFLGRENKCQIYAYLIYPSQSQNEFNPRQEQRDFSGLSNSSDVNDKLCVRYLGREQFIDFIDGQLRINSGMLQAFVQPLNNQNIFTNQIFRILIIDLIQVEYTPNFSTFTQRINQQNIYNEKLDVFQRACTFDGPQYFSDACKQISITNRKKMFNFPFQKDVLQGTQTKYLQDFMRKISDYIKEVTYGRYDITKMTCYFKTDKDSRFWFLWASSVLFSSQSPDEIKISRDPQIGVIEIFHSLFNKYPFFPKFQIPDIVPSITTLNNKPVSIQKNINCLMCNSREKQDYFFQIPYQMIVEYSNRNKINSQLGKIEIQTQGTSNSHIEVRLIKQDLIFINFTIILTKSGTIYVTKNNDVPDVFKLMYPKLDHQRYSELKTQQFFLNTQMEVCFNCYLLCTTQIEQRLTGVIDNSIVPKMKTKKQQEKLNDEGNGEPELKLKETQNASTKDIDQQYVILNRNLSNMVKTSRCHSGFKSHRSDLSTRDGTTINGYDTQYCAYGSRARIKTHSDAQTKRKTTNQNLNSTFLPQTFYKTEMSDKNGINEGGNEYLSLQEIKKLVIKTIDRESKIDEVFRKSSSELQMHNYKTPQKIDGYYSPTNEKLLSDEKTLPVIYEQRNPNQLQNTVQSKANRNSSCSNFQKLPTQQEPFENSEQAVIFTRNFRKAFSIQNLKQQKPSQNRGFTSFSQRKFQDSTTANEKSDQAKDFRNQTLSLEIENNPDFENQPPEYDDNGQLKPNDMFSIDSDTTDMKNIVVSLNQDASKSQQTSTPQYQVDNYKRLQHHRQSKASQSQHDAKLSSQMQSSNGLVSDNSSKRLIPTKSMNQIQLKKSSNPSLTDRTNSQKNSQQALFNQTNNQYEQVPETSQKHYLDLQNSKKQSFDKLSSKNSQQNSGEMVSPNFVNSVHQVDENNNDLQKSESEVGPANHTMTGSWDNIIRDEYEGEMEAKQQQQQEIMKDNEETDTRKFSDISESNCDFLQNVHKIHMVRTFEKQLIEKTNFHNYEKIRYLDFNDQKQVQTPSIYQLTYQEQDMMKQKLYERFHYIQDQLLQQNQAQARKVTEAKIIHVNSMPQIQKSKKYNQKGKFTQQNVEQFNPYLKKNPYVEVVQEKEVEQ